MEKDRKLNSKPQDGDIVLLNIPLKYSELYNINRPKTKDELREFLRNLLLDAKKYMKPNGGLLYALLNPMDTQDSALGLPQQLLMGMLESLNMELLTQIIIPTIPDSAFTITHIRQGLICDYIQLFVITNRSSITYYLTDKETPIKAKNPLNHAVPIVNLNHSIWYIPEIMADELDTTPIWKRAIVHGKAALKRTEQEHITTYMLYCPDSTIYELYKDVIVIDNDKNIALYNINHKRIPATPNISLTPIKYITTRPKVIYKYKKRFPLTFKEYVLIESKFLTSMFKHLLLARSASKRLDTNICVYIDYLLDVGAGNLRPHRYLLGSLKTKKGSWKERMLEIQKGNFDLDYNLLPTILLENPELEGDDEE